MKRIITTAAVFSIMLLPAVSRAETWTIDPDHSSIGFKVRHMMVSNVKGNFGAFSGVAEINDKDINTSTVNVTIDTSSINTGVVKRDNHLRSPEFLDTARYPNMTFKSRKIEKAGPDRLKVYGDLSIHGVTKLVVLDVEGPSKAYKDPWGKFRRGAGATVTINRKDFGLVWNKVLETGGVLVGDEVNISLEVEMIRK
jgi:polyisoprenoid-binding protein YceI